LTKQLKIKAKIDFANMPVVDRLICWLGVGLGSGLSPKAPGTMGSLAVLLLVPLWVYLGFFASSIVVALMCLVGSPICGRTADLLNVHDDSRIVWDEFAGQSLVVLPLLYVNKINMFTVALAFILFRLFDVWKPWPIGLADRHVHGGFGIMLDDILAAIMAIVVLIGCLAFI
jgi:phosphatidylglycerophosphatase A